MNNEELIIQHLIDIKGKVSGVEEHLKNLNGSVARHEKSINSNCSAISKISKRQAYYAGGISAICLLGGLYLKFL